MFTMVSGSRISYWRWGPAGRPGVVLVHGGGAHAHWWDHVAPWLVTDERSVVAIDLSGHGDSDHRSEYQLTTWAEEILAVGEDAGLVGPSVLVGHSLGGWSTTVAAADHQSQVRGLILVDARVIDGAGPVERRAVRAEPSRRRRYPTLAAAVARYRPEPAQEGTLGFVVEHVARQSARRTGDGWVWKFDPAVLAQSRPGAEVLERLECRLCLVRGEHGLVSPDVVAAMRSAVGPFPVVTVPDAGHHLMLDHPLSLASSLSTVLALWEVGAPSGRHTASRAPEHDRRLRRPAVD